MSGNQPVLDLTTATARHHQRVYGISETEYLAWKGQRDSAARRGIPFHFSLLGWSLWWRQELARLGPQAKRGRRRDQYVMARIRDRGAYEAGNVRCRTVAENAAEIDPDKHRSALLASWAARKAAGEVCHLAVRGDAHPRSKAVVTPLGRFGSAALAAEAHGISRQYASQLARMQMNGWSRA